MSLEPVELTEKAVVEVKNIMEHKGIPEGYGLRIGIKGGGCGALGYMLGFDKKKEGDIEYEREGIPIYSEKKQVMYLMGLKLDFYEGADERGFTFSKASLEDS